MEGENLWIIDDDMVSQFAMTYKIGQVHPHYNITTFYTVKEALNHLRKCWESKKGLPDKLLLDLGLPDLDGWDFLRELENIGVNISPFDIYIVSAFTNSTDRKRAQSHPLIKDYFDKPLNKNAVNRIFA